MLIYLFIYVSLKQNATYFIIYTIYTTYLRFFLFDSSL